RYWNMYEIASITAPPGQGNPAFGSAMSHGDVNGDGFSDLVVGSFNLGYPGKVYVWFGGTSFDTVIDITITGPTTGAFGGAVACGDVNNDGYDDILVGRYAFEARLYYGGNPMDTTADWIVHRPSSSLFSWFGHWVAISDLNGDNYGDMIVGDPQKAEHPHFTPGAVYIYWGAENPDTLWDAIIHGADNSNFGYTISSDYDVNGDGITDLAVGAPTAPGYFPRISIYYGGAEFDTVPDVKIYNPGGEPYYGNPISLMKDINGDGYDDLAAGAGGHKSIYIYYGGNPMDNQYDVALSDTNGLGDCVVGIDNANGDSFGDILVGNPHYGPAGNGRVYLYCGGNPFDSFPDAYAAGPDSQEIGWHVGYGGDMTNDGKDELIFSNSAASFPSHKVWIVDYAGVGVEEEKDQRHKTRDIRLHCHPNPFTTSTTISLTLPNIGHSAKGIGQNKEGIELKIYDVAGRIVKQFTLPTTYSLLPTVVTWDGKNVSGKKVSTGIYFIKGKIGSSQIKEKVVFVR
ncbi:FG-GAP repeat protein, partial [candidate division WOR-3 bacterium]|nr:FG-GAP repeat protein [candidate division WOR-3 bacterium]